MEENNTENAVTFHELKWDTDFFGVTCAKTILNRPLSLNEWDELQTKLKKYQFISIVNQNSEPANAQIIGKDTSAFLADVNIQFVKEVKNEWETPQNVTILQSLKRNEQVIEIANFQFSKFTEDPNFEERGGNQVYRQWIINSFNNPDKYYALSKDDNGEINGFLLHSYSSGSCVIELIAVSQHFAKKGIGTSLFKSVEYSAKAKDIHKIQVGTQVRNRGAINFYHKVGCKQTGCHQVYHLWNL